MIPADLVAVLLVGQDGGIESVYRNIPGGAPVDVDRAVVGQVMKERTGLLFNWRVDDLERFRRSPGIARSRAVRAARGW